MKIRTWKILLLALLWTSASWAVDTVYVQKHVTDTIYVMHRPDTLYLPISEKKSVSIQSDIAKQSLEQANSEISNDSGFTLPPPATIVYLSPMMAGNLLLTPILHYLLLDFGLGFENLYRGSLIFNFASMNIFGDVEFMDDKEWEGFRTITSFSAGYRQYLGTLWLGTSKKSFSRNTPAWATSLFVQAMIHPAFFASYEAPIEDSETGDYSGHFRPSIGASAGVGYALGASGSVFEFCLSVGYQYWYHSEPGLLKSEDVSFALVNGYAEDLFIRFEIQLGF